MKYELIIKAKYILPMNEVMDAIEDGFVAVNDGKLAAVGKADALGNDDKASETIDAGNSIVMPGLVNTHSTRPYILREMTTHDGAFYSTTDADSEGEEGLFFIWSIAELEELLGDDAPIAIEYWGVTRAWQL